MKLNIKYENAKALFRTHKQAVTSQKEGQIEAQSLQGAEQATRKAIAIDRVEPVKMTLKESPVENTLMKRESQMLMPRLGKILRRQRNGKFQRSLVTFDLEARELAAMTSLAAR